jgi:hypothetical protein
MLSLQALGGDGQARAALPGQWRTTDAALGELSNMARTSRGVSLPANNAAGLQRLLDGLPAVRRSVQTGTANVSNIDAFYSRFTDGTSSALQHGSLAGTSATAAADEVTALDLFAVPDLHSRVVGLGAGWAARGS